MLSIKGGIRGTGRASYYLELASGDYYLRGGEPLGVWHGKGTKTLGLKGTVEKAAFHDLLLGFAPDKSGALVQNAGAEKRQSAWDLTFGAPKALSVP